MICLACHHPTRGSLCPSCSNRLRRAPDRILPGGLVVVAAFEHEDVARQLVHMLKYRAVVDFADLVADLLAVRVPALPLVPVPRVWTRRLRYGVDPAEVLARGLSRRTGAPVFRLLSPPIHAPRRAGGDHRHRPARFGVRRPVDTNVVLVDDVVTTGATLSAAASVLGERRVAMAVAANSVPKVTSLSS